MDASHFPALLEEAAVPKFDSYCHLYADSLYRLYVRWCGLIGIRAKPDFTFQAAMQGGGIAEHGGRLPLISSAATDYILAIYPAAA